MKTNQYNFPIFEDEDIVDLKHYSEEMANAIKVQINKFGNPLVFKGTVSTIQTLQEIDDMQNGNIYRVLEENKNYIWNGTEWKEYSDNIDVSKLKYVNKLQGEQIIIENTCSCNSNLKIYGKTIQATGIPTPTSAIEIKNVTNLNFIKENEDGTVSETINFPFAEGQMLHEGDYIDEEGIHQIKESVLINSDNFHIAMPYEGICLVMSKTTGITLDYINLDGLCTHFENVKNNNIIDNATAKQYLNNNEFCFRNSNTKDRIYFKNSNFTTLEDWQNFFINNEVTIEYKKAKETVIQFVQQQQTAYDKLRLMYEGYNKITCTDEIKPTLKVTYYYNNDLNKTYAKRLDKIEKKIEKQNIVTGTEVETGRIIDGKKEYMKRLTTGNLSTGGEKTIATGLTNITQQRPITGVIGAEGQANFDIPLALTSYRVYCRLNSAGTNISIGNAGDLTAFSGFVDLYYTKN